MLFKNGMRNSKDALADSYLETLKEHREKVKAKTREIQKCIQDGLTCPKEETNEKTNGENTVL